MNESGNKENKNALSNKYFCWGLTVFLTFVACILFYLLLNNTAIFVLFFGKINKILMPVYFGMIIAYIITPLLNIIENKCVSLIFSKAKFKKEEKKKKLIRGISIFLTVVIALAAVFWLFYLMISQIIPSVQDIIANFDTYITNFQKWISTNLEKNESLRDGILKVVGVSSETLEKWLNGDILSFMSQFVPFINEDNSVDWTLVFPIIGKFLGGVGMVLLKVWNFILGFIISIYLLAGKEKFAGRGKKISYALFAPKTATNLINDVRFVHKTFIGYLGGKIIDSLIIGILCFIGTTLLQTPYAGLISLFVGVTNIIPYFGPFIGTIPSAILIFVVDPMHPLNMLFFIIFILVLQQVDGNLIGPKILGDSTGLEGVWVILSISLFGGFFGVPGMVIGVPLFAVLYAAVKGWLRKKLEKRNLNLPIETDDYINIKEITDEGEIIYKEKPERKTFRVPFVSSIKEYIIKEKNKKKTEKSDDNKKDE